MEKLVRFSRHALQQMVERGATQDDVLETVRSGEQVPAKHGRVGYRKNFQYQRLWGGQYYAVKQVLAVVAEEPETLVVVTVYTFYF